MDNQDSNSEELNPQQETDLTPKTFQHLKLIDTQVSHYSESDNEQTLSSSASIKFGGEQQLEDIVQHEYQPDEVPRRSILKTNPHDFKQIKNIEGKIIKHQQSIPNSSGLLLDLNQTSSSLSQQQESNHSELKFNEQLNSEIPPFKVKYPLSILKNSPLVQPAKFNNLKKIEGRIIPRLFLEEEDESGKIHFAGEIIIEPENTYKHRYNPMEHPEGSILKGSKHNQKRKSYDFSKLKNIEGKIISSSHKSSQSEFFDKPECLIDEKQQNQIQIQSKNCIQILDTQSQDENANSLDQQKHIVQFKGVEEEKQMHEYHQDLKPKKTILFKRSNSLDSRRLKDIDGKIIGRKNTIEEQKNVHFGIVIEGDQQELRKYLNQHINQANNIQKKPILKKETKLKFTPTKFLNKWVTIRKEFYEDTWSILETVEPQDLKEFFLNGIDISLLEDIIKVLKYKAIQEFQYETVAKYIEGLSLIENFQVFLTQNAKNDIKEIKQTLLEQNIILTQFVDKEDKKIQDKKENDQF